nr:SS18-like protein 2 [Oryctolagus cuniculus]XP_051701327.1 SS18-like protein 2 [Oryctolagus cuniculus]XP_051701328.1 SS18-like protein 2 [Oryctolagus cuniculus]XP_051701329.1 SS18-like protein 2 [Oryctolagus cuniculus]
MLVAFVPDWLRGSAEADQETTQRLLEENEQLIGCTVEYQYKGRASKCLQYWCVLRRSLIYLATNAQASPAHTSKAE